MSNFNPKQFILNDVNNGQKYEDGEGLQPATANDIVEGVAFCDEQREALMQTPEIVENGGNVGVKWVDTTINGRTHKKLQFENIKGDKGEKGKDGADGKDGVSFEEVKDWLMPYLPEQLGANGVDLTFDTSIDIQIGMAGRNGGDLAYGLAYNWDIYLNNEFVGNYVGVTSATQVITIPNSTVGKHKVLMICKLDNQDFCARSIAFHSEALLEGDLIMNSSIGSYDQLVAVKGIGSGFHGKSSIPAYCFHGAYAYCSSLVEAPKLTSTTVSANCYHAIFFYCLKLTKVFCSYHENLTISNAKNWLSVITTTGKLYSPNAVITYGLPANWTAEAL